MQNSELKSTSQQEENFHGLLYNFKEDTVRPSINIHTSKKKRGVWLDDPINQNNIYSVVLTLRVVLSTLAQLFDASGRHLSPAQMAGRIIYSKLSKTGISWDTPIGSFDKDLEKESRDWLIELVNIQENLLPVKRAWVQPKFKLCEVNVPADGSEFGYSAIAYIKSKNQELVNSTNAAAKCKISDHSVPINELSSQALASKLALELIKSVADMQEEKYDINFITDSSSSSYLFNPDKIIKERKKRNLMNKILKNQDKILAMNPKIKINMFWTSGNNNPSDLNSKSHKNIINILNGNIWRHGVNDYISQEPLVKSKNHKLFFSKDSTGSLYTPLPIKCEKIPCYI